MNTDGTNRRNAAHLKRLVRLIYLYGCFSKTQLPQLMQLNKNTLYKEYRNVQEVFDKSGQALEMYDKHSPGYMQLDADWLLENENYLINTYFDELFPPALLVRTARVLGYLGRHGPAAFADVLDGSRAIAGQEAQTLRNLLDALAALGLLQKSRRGKASLYALAPNPFEELAAAELDALYDFVDLASHVRFPGYHGHLLRRGLARLRGRRGLAQPPLFFIYNGALFHAVLDEDVMMALAPHLGNRLVEVRYRQAVEGAGEKALGALPTPDVPAAEVAMRVLPLRFLYDGMYGRVYLLAWQPETDRLVQLRLEQIYKVQLGRAMAPPPGALREVERRYAHCFFAAGISDDKDAGGQNWRLRLSFDEEALAARGMAGRPLREVPPALVAEAPKSENGRLILQLVVAAPLDLLLWLRGYGAAVRVERLTGAGDGEDRTPWLQGRLHTGWRQVLALYGDAGALPPEETDAGAGEGWQAAPGESAPHGEEKAAPARDAAAGAPDAPGTRQPAAPLYSALSAQLASAGFVDALDYISARAAGAPEKPAEERALRALAPDLFDENGRPDDWDEVPVTFTTSELEWLAGALGDEKLVCALPQGLRRRLAALLPPPPASNAILRGYSPPPAAHDAAAQGKAFAFFADAVRGGWVFSCQNHTAAGQVAQGVGVAWRIEYMASTGLFYLLFYDVARRTTVLARLDRLREYKRCPWPKDAPPPPTMQEAYATDARQLVVQVANRHNAPARFCALFNTHRRLARYLPQPDVFHIEVGYYAFEEHQLLDKLLGFGPLVKVLQPAPVVESICAVARAALAGADAADGRRDAGPGT